MAGSDTNLALFNAALREMRRTVPNPALVVLPGDFLMHNFPTGVSHVATMERIANSFAADFPRAQFAITLGNNDSACGDYRSDLGGSDLASIARVWAPLVNRGGRAPEFARDFSQYGHYVARLSLPQLRLVSVNSVLFSSLYRGDCNGVSNAGARELSWLRGTLAATPANVRNVVLLHIPPGYDAVATEMAHGFVPWRLVQPALNSELVTVLADKRNRVAFVIAGHTHHFDVRVDAGVPILVLGSVSPVYGNDPAFYALRVSDAGSVDDFDAWTYDLQLESWAGPRAFDRTWSVNGLSAAALNSLHARLGRNPALRERWDAQTNGWSSDGTSEIDVWAGRWRVPWCAQTVLAGNFASCAGLQRRALAARLLLIATPLFIVAVAVGATILWRRRHRVLS